MIIYCYDIDTALNYGGGDGCGSGDGRGNGGAYGRGSRGCGMVVPGGVRAIMAGAMIYCDIHKIT